MSWTCSAKMLRRSTDFKLSLIVVLIVSTISSKNSARKPTSVFIHSPWYTHVLMQGIISGTTHAGACSTLTFLTNFARQITVVLHICIWTLSQKGPYSIARWTFRLLRSTHYLSIGVSIKFNVDAKSHSRLSRNYFEWKKIYDIPRFRYFGIENKYHNLCLLASQVQWKLDHQK